MVMNATWTIEVGGTVRKYKNAKFNRSLVKDAPTSFEAQIEYAEPAVNFMDLVEIKRNETIEWKGYVETITIEWDENGRYYNVSGRDTTLILWKKMNEEFTQYAEGIEGFFGSVNASELIKLLLRTPRSDLPSESPTYKYNKQGWGIDANKFSEIQAERTSYGDPNWTILRKRSVAGWRNTGSPYNTGTLDVTSQVTQSGFTVHGASPYIDSDDGNTSYIESKVLDAYAIYQIDNLTASATGLNSVKVSVKWYPAQTWYWWIQSRTEVHVSNDAGSSWRFAGEFGGRTWGISTPEYKVFTFDISSIFTDVSQLQSGNCRIAFVCADSGLENRITYAFISVNYQVSGTQDASDFFSLTFSKERITGIYFESRADGDSFPRHYEIVTLSDTLETWETGWAETDPNSHIALLNDYQQIDFDSYHNEVAHYSKDFGSGNIDTFDFKFCFWIHSSDNHPYCYVPFAVTNLLSDYATIQFSMDYFIACFAKCDAGTLTFWLQYRDDGGLTATQLYELTTNTLYFVRVVRSGTFLKCIGYSDSSLSHDFELWSTTITLNPENMTYRYRIQAVTYDGLVELNEAIDTDYVCDGRSDPWDVEEWSTIGAGDPWLDSDDDATNMIQCPIATANLGNTMSYFTFADADAKYSSITVSDAKIVFSARHTGHTGDGAQVRIYIWDGTQWIYDGTFDVSVTAAWTYHEVDVDAWIDTLAKINALRVKFEFSAYGGNEDGSVQVSYVKLHLHGTGYWSPVTHTDGDVFTFYPEEIVLVSDTDNSTTKYRDIIHSWIPTEIGNIRIKITDSDAHAWAITQVYVYKAEEIDYRIAHEGADDEGSEVFALNQYIHSILFDDTYGTAVGPLNIPEGRVIDQINSVLRNLHTTYVPYEWYMSFESNNAFHICDRVGDDTAVEFNLGTHMLKNKKSSTIEDTAQRIKIKGSGEGQEAEAKSSGWLENTTAMTANKTFFEEIVSEKETSDSEIAELIGNVILKERSPAIVQIVTEVSNDTHGELDYDVGDTVLITDALTGLSSSQQKIYYITKRFDNNGEHITLFCGAPYEDEETVMREIYKRIKNIELSGGIKGSWTSQEKGSLIAVNKLETLFEKTSREEELSTGITKTDPKWYTVNDATNGTSWVISENGIEMNGVTANGPTSFTVDYYYDVLIANEEGTADIEFLLYPEQNPKIEFEFKAYEPTVVGPTAWNDDDTFEIGLAKDSGGSKYGHWIKVVAIGSSNFNVYAVWRDIGASGETSRFLCTISANYRYRFIIQYDYSKNLVTYELWDVTNKSKFPIVAVRQGANVDSTQSVHPLHMDLTSSTGAGKRARAHVYHVKIQFERVHYEVSG